MSQPSPKTNQMTPAMTSIRMSQVINSVHVNKDKLLNGGQLLKWVDICACLSAERLAGYPCVTVSVDDLSFDQSAKLGQVLNLQAQVNRAFRTSMEVGVKVFCEDLQIQERFNICDAFITFVALGENGTKVVLPQVHCESTEEKLAYSLANERRKVRINYNQTMKSLLHNSQLLSISRSPVSPSVCTPHPPSLTVVNGDATRVESVELVLPPHANHHGNTFGGQIMAWMENVASISAGYFSSDVSVLRSVDMVYFRQPSTVGDRIILKSIVNNVFKDSFEVGVRVEAYRYENGCIGPTRHINSAFLTYDLTASTRTCLPRFLPETEDGERRAKEATARRKMRLDRKYVLSSLEKDRLSVAWTPGRSNTLRYSNVQALIRLETKADWKVVADKDGVSLSTRDEKGVLSFCATVKMEPGRFPIERVFRAIKGMEKRTCWDPLMLSRRVLVRVSDEDVICQTVMKSESNKTAKPNDFVLLISDRKPTTFNEPYRVAMRSVILSDCPPVDEYCRSEVACAGLVLRQKHGMCVELSYYNETNPKVVAYILRDVAGLSTLYSQIVHSLLDYVMQNGDINDTS